MPITLVTGTPGAGKTLYTLSKLVPGALADLLGDDGTVIKRRLCVGGVRDLLLDHVPLDVPRIRDWDSYLKSGAMAPDERHPGQPPLDVPMRADNWHLWCIPGDLIVIDEAQHVFKPMAAGRAVPAFISNLEEHRHYGVDFILITQHPNLLHTNVRALVNPHLHLRRLFGRAAAAVYEWDRCAPVTAYSQATNRKVWRHDKKAYAVYKSSELHTKFSRSFPLPVIVAVLAAVALPAVWYYALNRTVGKYGNPDASAAVPGPDPAAAGHGSTPGAGPGHPVRGGERFIEADFRVPGRPGRFDHVVESQESWPVIIAGCWRQGEVCGCVTREDRIRVIYDRPALCLAVTTGDLQPPVGLPRPVPASAPVTSVAAAPAAPGASP